MLPAYPPGSPYPASDFGFGLEVKTFKQQSSDSNRPTRTEHLVSIGSDTPLICALDSRRQTKGLPASAPGWGPAGGPRVEPAPSSPHTHTVSSRCLPGSAHVFPLSVPREFRTLEHAPRCAQQTDSQTKPVPVSGGHPQDEASAVTGSWQELHGTTVMFLPELPVSSVIAGDGAGG